jgi:hypothetical protein
MAMRVPRLPFSLDPLIGEAKRRMRRRRVWIAASLILIGGATVASVSLATSGGPGSTGGAPGVHGLLSQVRSSFGDSRLLAASINGRTLTVKVVAPTEPSAVSATFEAQMLAAALHDAQVAAGQTPINAVRYVDAVGKAIPGYGVAPVGSSRGHPVASVPALANDACRSVAQSVQTSTLTVRSALTLPYGGGACAFTLQGNPTSFVAPLVVGKLVNAMGDPNNRPFLVELDDHSGVPLFVDGYTPAGGGVAYTRPSSHILFGPWR